MDEIKGWKPSLSPCELIWSCYCHATLVFVCGLCLTLLNQLAIFFIPIISYRNAFAVKIAFKFLLLFFKNNWVFLCNFESNVFFTYVENDRNLNNYLFFHTLLSINILVSSVCACLKTSSKHTVVCVRELAKPCLCSKVAIYFINGVLLIL